VSGSENGRGEEAEEQAIACLGERDTGAGDDRAVRRSRVEVMMMSVRTTPLALPRSFSITSGATVGTFLIWSRPIIQMYTR